MSGAFNDGLLPLPEVQRLLRDRGFPPWQRRVLERFAAELEHGWYPLLNRFAPDTRDDCPDAVLIGPAGVWSVLLRENRPDWEVVRRVFSWTARQLSCVETPSGVLSEALLQAAVVHPYNRGDTGRRGDFPAFTEADLDRMFKSRQRWLARSEAHQIARSVAQQVLALQPFRWNAGLLPHARKASGGRQISLASPARLREQDREAAMRRRDWRVFLDSTQVGVLRRHYSGPARYTGPAGTGKTVLALHRLAYLAQRKPGKLLFTSHVSSLTRIAGHQFQTLAPHLAHRVEFQHLHGWASKFLRSRGYDCTPDADAVDQIYREVWADEELTGPLRRLRPSPAYWKDEIDWVIKGRGIDSLAEYESVYRVGRGITVRTGNRKHVWRFYCRYEQELAKQGVYDHNDVLAKALAELERDPLPEQYAAVVVDELQDLTLTGLRLVLAISGHGPDQLLLVGDGQQQIYPGGWRLSEAGINLQGRGEVLTRNYRNRRAVAEQAAKVPAINRFEDFDGGPSVNLRSAETLLPGGTVTVWRGTDQVSAVVDALRKSGDVSDTAVLTATNQEAEYWLRALLREGFDACPLKLWDGSASRRIHVGTVHRAKGTEFRAVFLPLEPPVDNGYGDELEAYRRRLVVAMTRARDSLWIGLPEYSSLEL